MQHMVSYIKKNNNKTGFLISCENIPQQRKCKVKTNLKLKALQQVCCLPLIHWAEMLTKPRYKNTAKSYLWISWYSDQFYIDFEVVKKTYKLFQQLSLSTYDLFSFLKNFSAEKSSFWKNVLHKNFSEYARRVEAPSSQMCIANRGQC